MTTSSRAGKTKNKQWRDNFIKSYLNGDLWHSEICGVDSDYVKRVIKEEGL